MGICVSADSQRAATATRQPPPSTPTTPAASSVSAVDLVHHTPTCNAAAARPYDMAAVLASAVRSRLFDAVLKTAGVKEGPVAKRYVVTMLNAKGFNAASPLVEDALSELPDTLSFDEFEVLLEKNNIIDRALSGQLVIPDFEDFGNDLTAIYNEVLPNVGGENASYIPQLANVNPEQFSISMCSVDGQQFNIGDSKVPYCVQSCSKPITYAMGQEMHGIETVLQHIGMEPSGRAFNEICLDARARDADRKKQKTMLEAAFEITDAAERAAAIEKAKKMKCHPAIPHNPLINAGAIMAASLITKREEDMGTTFDRIMGTWAELAGTTKADRPKPTFGNSVFLSERASADRNFCLGYMMQGEGAFPKGTNLVEILELYFMCCSIECTNEMMSVIAATLANHGINPLTGKRVFSPQVVRNALSVMGTCGMYDFSGEFAFSMGFPAKSGVGGGILIVIPNVGGFATWSPRLDLIGNSVRGVHVCRLLGERFRFHNYDALRSAPDSQAAQEKKNPRRDQHTTDASEDLTSLMWAAYDGDVRRASQLLCRGVDVRGADYDGRTALHVAASEGHEHMVKYLLRVGADVSAKDRFGNNALVDAERHSHVDVARLLTASRSTNPPKTTSLPNCIIRALDTNANGRVELSEFEEALKAVGLSVNHPRLEAAFATLEEQGVLTASDVEKMLAACPFLLVALQGSLTMKDFLTLEKDFSRCFELARKNNGGEVATYIPELAKADPKSWGVAICSIDGQRINLGEVNTKFCVQSCSKVITYCAALEEMGKEKVFQHVGREPSGRAFNEAVLDTRRKPAVPHNPYINAGAIMSCSLVQGGKPTKERISHIMKNYWEKLNGGVPTDYCHDTYKSESRTAARNRCLAFMMQEAGAFPETIQTAEDLMENLEFYFQCCSIMQDAESMSIIAATLANGGVNPTTNERVFQASTVRDCMSLMYSCGMYDDSGEFAFKVGFPSKSGVAGALLIVIPNVCGICTWSPKLGPNGNSVRGMDFCEQLTKSYLVHAYDKPGTRWDLTLHKGNNNEPDLGVLIHAAANGDVNTVRMMYSKAGARLINMGDYDARTAVHLAAAEGQVDVLKYFIGLNEAAGDKIILLNQTDRWGCTPLDDASKHQRTAVVDLLNEHFQ